MAASTAQAQTTVQYEVRDAIAHVTLDAPPLNILTGAMMTELAAVVERAQADRSVAAIAVTANGTAFSAGADVGEHRPENAPAMIAAFSRLFSAFGACEVPIVMAVDGPALGAGFELALMADILLVSTRATFGQPEIRLGFFAPVGVSWLSARVGPARAVEITATGHSYPAAEMAAMGLVSRVVPPSELTDTLASVLGELRRASPAVMRLNVRLVRQLQGRPFEAGRLEAERVFLDELMALDDVNEGVAAFFGKRRPVWHNR
ncbi:MAG TPA: enoyl-CoA hydratase/isomerase family protein [Gemmatimonadaceae bacterium]|nr:enoyl-CoA hydratase/isomerase family protein [Gemmatimonadaceae bacterium]